MIKKQNKIKELSLRIFVILEILIIIGAPMYSAQASIFGGVGSGVIEDFIEDSLNTSVPDSLKPISEAMNSMGGKGMFPEVGVNFNNMIPKPGEEMRATADLSGITNPDDAYYTWYLKRADSGDDEEEWKQNATKAMISAYFDPMVFDQVFNGGNGDGILQDSEWPEDTDDDGYVAHTGGDNQKNTGTNYYYVYDKETGEMFELGEGSKGGTSQGGCPDGYTSACMLQDNQRTCDIWDPPIEFAIETIANGGSGGGGGNSGGGGSGGSGGNASANVTGGEDSTTTGLRFSRCVDAGRPICSTDGAFCANGGDPYCRVNKDSADGHFFDKLNDACPHPRDVYKTFEAGFVVGAECKDFEEMGYLKEFECEGDLPGEDDFRAFSSPSMHLFPVESFNAAGEPQTYGMQDGEFGIDAERFWGTDPRSSSTTPLAINDEALIVGLGVKEFVWEYQPGDEVGVVVEGQSGNPTKHEDATSMSVFAFMSGGCKPGNTGEYSIEVNGKDLFIPTAEMDPPWLNNCLHDNLVKPGASEYEQLEVEVTSGQSGAGQIYAVTGGQGHQIKINAVVSSDNNNIHDSSTLHYQWNIKCGSDSGTVCDEGADITQELYSLAGLGKTKGVNLSSIEFQAEFPDSCFDGGRGAMCVTAKVNAPFNDAGSSYGSDSLIIPIQESGGEIRAFIAETDGNTVSTGEEICGDGIDLAACRVVLGEIIGVEMPVPDGGTDDLITWTVNGKEYTCDSSVSSECSDGSNTSKIFFPITGSVGDLIMVVGTYGNPGEGEYARQSTSRAFKIVKPSISINPSSGGNRKIIGQYVDLDGNKFDDKSDKFIEFTKGNSISIETIFDPPFIKKDTKIEWTAGNEQILDETLQLIPESSQNIALKGRYQMSAENRLALQNIFGISQFNTSGTYMRANTRLVENATDEFAKKNNVGFFATTSQNTPAYFIFLLKMVLLVSLMLFVSKLALGITRI
jgi:hypothetical protein